MVSCVGYVTWCQSRKNDCGQTWQVKETVWGVHMPLFRVPALERATQGNAGAPTLRGVSGLSGIPLRLLYS